MSALMSTPVPWPSLGQLLSHFKTRRANVGRVLRLATTVAWSRWYRDDFEWQVRPLPLAAPLLRQHGANSFAPLFHAFVDQRLGMRQRFAHYHHNLVAAETRLAGAKPALLAGRRHELLALGAFRVDLGFNEISMEEGLWSLCLRDAEGRRLSSLSFSFLREGGVLIGSVQGPRLEETEAVAGIRQATGALEGLRPPHFLLLVLRLLARHWKLPLAGVDPAHKAFARRRHRGCPHSFDYREFWQSAGAAAQDGGHWRLAGEVQTRDPADAPAKKRAMYRRRAELVAGLPERLAQALAG